MMKIALALLFIIVAGAHTASAGGIDFKKVKGSNVYKDLPGVKTPPPVTTLGSKAKDCTTVQTYEYDRITGRRMPSLAYKCTEGNIDFYSTLPPVQ